MKNRYLTVFTIAAVIAAASFSCSDDDSGQPSTTSGTTTTGTTTTGTTTTGTTTTGTTTTGTTTTGTTTSGGGNGAFTINGNSSTDVNVSWQENAGTMIVNGTGGNGNTCSVTLGDIPTATKTYTIVNADLGSAGPNQALVTCLANNQADAYGSLSGSLQVTVNGSARQISFSNTPFKHSDNGDTIAVSATLNLQ